MPGFLILVLTFFLIPSFGSAQSTIGEITILAQHQERTKEGVFAKGLVKIKYKDIVIFADSIWLNSKTKDVLAEGNVSIQLSHEVISMKSVRFNLDSWEGLIEQAQGMVQPSIFYKAAEVEVKNRTEYSLKKASITSCAQPVPRWKFSCSKATFKKDKYVAMWNTVFSIKKIPIFYLPYIKYPLGQERNTGLLTPQFGYSGPKGIFYSQAFYLVLGRNMDATFNFDAYSARGIGGGLEYRYLFNKGMGGQLKFYLFNFKKDPERNDPDRAYIIRFSHNQPLPYGFSLIANIDYQSSYDFLREFDNNYKRALISNRSSQVYMSRSWAYFNFNARVSRFETYFTELDNSIINQYKPGLSFSISKLKLFSPFYFSFLSRYESREYGWTSSFMTGTQRKSQSLNFIPSLTVPFNSIPWLTLTSSLSANLTYYFQSYAPSSSEIVDEPALSKVYSADFKMTGPIFMKIYYGADESPKLKHIIEPSFSYHYESQIEDRHRFLSIGGLYRKHYLQYGLTNRFLINKDNSAREIFTLGISQIFYLNPEESPLSRYRINGKIPQLSNINGYLRFYPSTKYNVDFTLSFDPYHKAFSRLNLGVKMGASTDPAFLKVNWYKSINPYYKNYFWNRHQISLDGGLKIPALSLETLAQISFNIQEAKMLYSMFAVVYHYQCLDFQTELRIFYFREKPEFQFRFSFGLGNIGKTTDFFGGLRF